MIAVYLSSSFRTSSNAALNANLRQLFVLLSADAPSLCSHLKIHPSSVSYLRQAILQCMFSAPGPVLNSTRCSGVPWCHRAHTRSREYLKYIKPRSVIVYEHFFVFCLLSYPQRTTMRQLYFVSGRLDNLNLKFTSCCEFSNFQPVFGSTLVCSGSIFTAAATFSVLIHLLTQVPVRAGVGRDSGRVLTRTLGEYLGSGLPPGLITDRSSCTFIDLHPALQPPRVSPYTDLRSPAAMPARTG